MPNKNRIFVILGIILLLSLGLRVWGISWGLPHQDRFTTLYIDEYTPFWVLSRMNPSQLDFNPRYGHNPTFSYYQVGAVLLFASKLGLANFNQSKSYFLDHPDEYARLYVVGRSLYVFYGLALTLLMFGLGYLISNNPIGGLLAALFYAVIPISVIQSHVMDMSVPTSFWLGLSFFAMLKAFRSNNNRWLYAAAFIAGLAVSSKYTAAPVGLLLLYTGWKISKDLKKIGILLLIAGGAYVLGSPYVLLDAPQMMDGLFQMFQSAAGTSYSPEWTALLYPFAHYDYAVGIPLSLCAVAGFVLAIRQKHPAAVLSALFLIPFLFLLCRSSLHITRYLNETLPFFLPFSVLPILALLRIKKRWSGSAALGVVILCLSRVPYTLAINQSLTSQMDPRDTSSAWIIENIAAGKRIGLEQEANFMMPGHLYMDYWKGIRYPADKVAPPGYTYAAWDRTHMRWDPRHPDYWVGTNFFFTGVNKNLEQDAQFKECVKGMNIGYKAIVSFERVVRWGPFHYSLPKLAGNDWREYFPVITIYEAISL